MRRLAPVFRIALCCLLLCPALPLALGAPAPAEPPTRVEAAYEVFKGSIKVATVTERFTRLHDHYSIESVSEATGMLAWFKPEAITVTSSGAITAHGLRPAAFSSSRKLDKDRNTRAEFDWAHKRITLTDRAGTRTLPLPDGTQDRLSTMYQFIFMALEGMTELKFNMTNGSKVDIYQYHLTRGQSVTTPAGTSAAIYAASPVEHGSSRTEVWLAVDHANLPFKVVITDSDGSQYTQILTRLEVVP